MAVIIKKINTLPRIPLRGAIDLTYRCNNRCKHCWLWMPEQDKMRDEELTFDEIRQIVDEARAMGCQEWNISGGEPMLRSDFVEIFDYITSKAVTYSINTNGTLITPDIAKLMKRRGSKMVALYGATREVYDDITRNPGGFDMLMNGISLLKNVGAGFIMQLIPLRDNWHQWQDMITLAERLSSHWRIGAPWLFYSKSGNPQQNKEIEAQRLRPADISLLNPPKINHDSKQAEPGTPCRDFNLKDNQLFAECISMRRDFHIDPYGRMSWCAFIKDPALRYDLHKGSFSGGWNSFIPSCKSKILGSDEYKENCGSCELREDCQWCAVFSYLEFGRYSAPIPYLCQMARENQKLKQKWKGEHRRYFRVAEITICLESELNFHEIRFPKKLMTFSVDGPGDDNVIIAHEFHLPDLEKRNLGKVLYSKPPWIISNMDNSWFYRIMLPELNSKALHMVAIFNDSHTNGKIFHKPGRIKSINTDGWNSLSFFPTDQIWLARLLAERQAVMLHSAAAIINNRGVVFVGHSEAGKSTMMEMIKKANIENGLDAEILCDDRNIIRKWDGKWRVYGTWSHGTTSDVSAKSAPMSAIFFLHKDYANHIEEISDKKLILRKLLATLIRPVETTAWWQKELTILEKLIKDISFYIIRFDKSGKIIYKLLNGILNKD